ncbi:MAG: 4-hydroxythreonine-4-phosphate dehydrogenase PdxA, partial [Rhodospirillaceae bacterium]
EAAHAWRNVLYDPSHYDGVDLEVLGDPAVVAEGAEAAGVSLDRANYRMTPFTPVEGIATTRAQATADAGRECLELLVAGSKRVLAGDADGVVFAPLNKTAMHLGGLTHEDEMRFLADKLDWKGYVSELNVMDAIDSLWTTRVTSHVPLKDVASYITHGSVLAAIRFADETLKRAGFEAPRVGVAALNPHAGDGGNFGREEIDVLTPATEAAAKEGIDVVGPLPSDTIFVRATKGGFDVVVTMYHDQGQIAMKLMGFGRGVTVLGGLPVPVSTCAHGTAYDIAGQGIATPESFKIALAICKAMAISRLQAGQTGEREAS